MKKEINIEEIKKTPIAEFLSSVGIQPKRKNGNNWYYCSPLREENNPSFHVDVFKNLWYDHGIGEGGTIIDLIIKHYHCSVRDALERLSSMSFSFHQPMVDTKEHGIKITDIKPVANYALIQYCQSRKISLPTAKRYLKEVHYKNADKAYFALGFENVSGGFELRNKYFKGCASPKDFSHIKNDSTTLAVFEGFFDFLSFIELTKAESREFDFLVLNSLSFIEKAIPTLLHYKEVYLFLDNDNAGNSATSRIIDLAPTCRSVAGAYQGHVDLNDFHKNNAGISNLGITHFL